MEFKDVVLSLEICCVYFIAFYYFFRSVYIAVLYQASRQEDRIFIIWNP